MDVLVNNEVKDMEHYAAVNGRNIDGRCNMLNMAQKPARETGLIDD